MPKSINYQDLSAKVLPELRPVYQAAINRKPETPLIAVRNIRKVYRMGEEKVVALDRVSLDIYRGEIICLLGSSGSGKSTFLNMLAGLEKPTSGEIFCGSIPVTRLSEADITIFRQKNVGFIFQAYNLLQTMTALENVAIPLNFRGMALKERNKIALNYLEKVGIGKLANRKPNQMSGGQQQRVGIARALTTQPKIIFADEPTGNLDTTSTSEVLKLLFSCVRENNQTLIIVTHDPNIAQNVDIVITISDGNIVRISQNQRILAEKEASK